MTSCADNLYRYITKIHTSDRLQRAITAWGTYNCIQTPSQPEGPPPPSPPTDDSFIPPIQQGMFRCTPRCVSCQEHVLEWDSFRSHSTGAYHQLRGNKTCTTSNIRNSPMVTDPRSKLKYSCGTALWSYHFISNMILPQAYGPSRQRKDVDQAYPHHSPMVSTYKEGMTYIIFFNLSTDFFLDLFCFPCLFVYLFYYSLPV